MHYHIFRPCPFSVVFPASVATAIQRTFSHIAANDQDGYQKPKINCKVKLQVKIYFRINYPIIMQMARMTIVEVSITTLGSDEDDVHEPPPYTQFSPVINEIIAF